MTEAVASVLGLFASPEALLAAVRRLRQRGWRPLDACSPYPVHGLDEALGLRKSPLGGMVLVMGILGALVALGFQYWVSAVDYPLVTGGKAPDSWEAFVPVMFELTVLFATFTAGLGMLTLLCGLPNFGHPLLATRAMAAITRDRFAVVLAGPGAAQALLEAGAEAVETLPEPAPAPVFTSRQALRALAAIAAACLVAGFTTHGAVRLLPQWPPLARMNDQPRVDAQAASRLFPDRAAMRMPAPHTLARGHLPAGVDSQDAAASLVNPLPRTPEVLAQGRLAYGQRCRLCHGPLGDGRGSLTGAYGAQPANLQAQRFLDLPDGGIYWVIVHGKNAMPGHEGDLDEDQRWAVVHYLRALQRAQHAREEDLEGGP